MQDIYIRKLQKDDWQEYRAIRLRALRQNGGMYLTTYDNAKAREDAFWIDQLCSDDMAIFALYDGAKIIGLTGIFKFHADQSGKTAILGMSFIDEAYRGHGLSRLLYEARIDWAKAQSRFTKIRVAHREGNEASRRANQRFGFEYFDSQRIQFADGSEANEHQYELKI